MNTTASPATKPGKNGSPPTTTKPPAPAQPGASKEAKRLAATILEVLAGVRTPPDAAQALSISVPRYYLLEQRALDSLVAGCEPRRQGRMATPERESAHLRKELARSQRDCARQQALVRLAQRTVGLAAPPTDPAKSAAKNGKRKPKRPVVRALKAAARLQLDDTRHDADLAPTANGASTPDGAKAPMGI